MDREDLVNIEEYGEDEELKAAVKKARKREQKTFILGLLTGIVLVLCALIWAFVGRMVARHVGIKSVIKEVSKSDSLAFDSSMIEKMDLIENTLDSYFLYDYTNEQLIEGAYDGMLSSLGDKYSDYYSAEEYAEVLSDLDGVYYGIGAYIIQDEATGICLITGIIANSPAEAAGLQADDYIYYVEDTITQGMDTNDVVKLIRGDKGTIVHLTILRDGEEMKVDVKRGKVESPTVEYEMKEDNVGYILITTFDTVTVDQFTDALATLKGQGAEGIIIDVRSNLGGSLDAVNDILRQILPKGVIVYTEDKNGEKEEYFCDGTRELKMPMVVLTNGYSASASEILTGAIKDYDKGVIVGTTTYGKGVVQKLFPMVDGSAIKFTVSHYFTPSGVCIDGTGIEPDVVVEWDEDAYDADGTDNQLDAGIKELRKLMK